MYRNDLGTRDRGGAIAAVAAIHVGLIFMLLHMSGRIDLTDPQSVLRTIDLTAPPPPPPSIPPPARASERERPKEKEGGSSPKNIKSEATPVAAPKAEPLLPNPVVGAAPWRGVSAVGDPAVAGVAASRFRRASCAGSAAANIRARSCAAGRAAGAST